LKDRAGAWRYSETGVPRTGIMAQLKVAAPVLNLALGKMRKAEKIEKNQNGLVRLVKKAA
jgi:hypothetical protein